MNRYLLSSPSFPGNLVLVYVNKVLTTIDLMECPLELERRAGFLATLPIQEHELDAYAAKFSKGLAIVQEDYEPTLEDFKREYPYKRNTHLLAPIWERMNAMDRAMAWVAAKDYRKYCERNKEWYKQKIAAKWLKDKEYLNPWKTL